MQLDAELVLAWLRRWRRDRLFGLRLTQFGEFGTILEDFGAVEHSDAEIHVFAVAIDRNIDVRIDRGFRNPRHQVLAVLDRLPAHGDDDVVRLEAGFVGWAALLHFADQYTRAGTERL